MQNSADIDIFDTTLRDGTQGEKIGFSAKDKLRIARKPDRNGFDYIEGGWPGSNPTDMDFFELDRVRVIIQNDSAGEPRSEATIRLMVDDTVEHSVAEEVGPVHALDRALRTALQKFYPQVDRMHLQNYKVRVLDGQDGTDARVRVLIDSGNAEDTWGTVGVSKDIIDASWQALCDSYTHFLSHHPNSNNSQKKDHYEMSV